MSKGFGGGFPGGGNMQALLAQAQKMQQNVAEAQEKLKDEEVTATSGGGMVTVVMTAEKLIKSIKINKEAVDPEDVEMLEDLVLSAVSEALSLADAKAKEVMGRATGGLNIPGF